MTDCEEMCHLAKIAAEALAEGKPTVAEYLNKALRCDCGNWLLREFIRAALKQYNDGFFEGAAVMLEKALEICVLGAKPPVEK